MSSSQQQDLKENVANQVNQMKRQFRSQSSYTSPINRRQIIKQGDSNISNINMNFRNDKFSNNIQENDQQLNNTYFHKFYAPKNFNPNDDDGKQHYFDYQPHYQDIPLWRQSVTTWRVGNPVEVSFTKQKRFKKEKQDGFMESHIKYDSHLSKKGAPIGSGKREFFKRGFLQEASRRPSAHTYNIKRCFDKDTNVQQVPMQQFSYEVQDADGNIRKLRATDGSWGHKTITHDFPIHTASESQRGRTFSRAKTARGTGDKYLSEKQKAMMKTTEALFDPTELYRTPAPNSYITGKPIGKGKRAVSFSFRNGVKKINQEPGPSDYTIKDKMFKNNRFGTGTHIGYGKKYDFTTENENTPGPGAYTLPGGAFEKALKPRTTLFSMTKNKKKQQK